MRKLKEWEWHVFSHRTTNICKDKLLRNKASKEAINNTKRAFCGATLDYERLFFQDADHAISNNMSGSRHLPCPKCREKMIEYLLEGTK